MLVNHLFVIKKIYLLFSFLILCSYSAFSVEHFAKAYGEKPDHEAVFFKPVDDGFVIVGSAIDSTYHTRGYYILKLNKNGIKQWEKSYSDAFSFYTNGVTILSNGNIAIIGTHAGILYSALAEVVILDSTGNFLNSRTYPPLDGWGTSGTGIILNQDSSIAISLYTDGFISTNYYSIYTLNADLSINWTEFIGYDGSLLNAHSLTKASANNFFSLSYYDTYYFSANLQYQVSAIRKFNSQGQVILDSLYQFQATTNSISATQDGGVIIGSTLLNNGQNDLQLIKLDSVGNFLWDKHCGSYLNESTVQAIQAFDGGYLVLSTIEDPILPNQNDILLVKTNSTGDSLWSRKIGSILNDIGLHIEETADSNIAVLGSTNGFESNKIFFALFDSHGNIPKAYTILAPMKYLCSTDTLQLTIDPMPNPSSLIVWNTGDTLRSLPIHITGNYFAQIIDTSGTIEETNFISAFFATTPQVQLGSDTSGICINSSLSNLFQGDFTVKYQWYLNGSLLPGETNTSIVPGTTGLYKLIASNYCSTDSDQKLIDTIYSIPAQPTLIFPSIDYVCEHDSLQLIASSNPAYAFQWYFADYLNWYLQNGATDSIFYANHNGYFFVRITDQNGCINYSDPATVRFDNVLPIVNANGPSSICDGQQVELSSSSGTEFMWNTGDTTSTILVGIPGDYSVSFIDQYGCPKETDTIQISVLAKPMVSIGPDTILCNNLTYLMDAGPGFNSYLWNYGATSEFIALFSGSSSIDSELVIVNVTDTNGCTNSDTALVVFDVCDYVNEFQSANTKVYPSVLGSEKILNAESDEQNNLLIIFDSAGKEIYRVNFDYRWKGTLNFPNGIYMYQLLAKANKKVQGKIIIN